MEQIDNEFMKKTDYLSLNSAKNVEEALQNYKREAEIRY